MKIAFSGVQCVGKSTLLHSMENMEKFKNLEFVYECIRKLKGKVKINENGDDNTQIAIANCHIENLERDNTVLDRCLLDCYAYTLWMYENGKITEGTKKIIEDLYNNNIIKYDKIFYIRPEFDIIPDGVRSISNEFRNETLKHFEHLVNSFSVKNKIVILTGSVENRIKQIEEALDEEIKTN